LNILIIEDESIISSAMQRVFCKDGHSVCIADSYEAFAENITLFDPDLVFLDLKIPGRSGIDILKELRTLVPNIRVIMMSGYMSEKDFSDAQELGVERFLKKPFDDIFSLRQYTKSQDS
jgi:DNA-binding response OmpR family regulator